jgi:hypothetical protein
MQNALNLAVIDGTNVGAAGFEMTLAYNIGNDQRMIACNNIATAFLSLNSKYKVNVIGLDWPVFLDAENNGYLPMYDVGWLADFADPDNFCEPYQATWGAFMTGQIVPADNAQPADQALVDDLIVAAMIEPDFNTRKDMYWELQQRYYDDVPSYCLVQPLGRRFVRDWVKGWYYNSLYPGGYYYDIYKSVVSNPVVDVDASATIVPGPGATQHTTEIWNGGMYYGYLTKNATQDFQNRTAMQYTLHVEYASGAVSLLLVAVGMKRNSSLETQYPNATQKILSPGEDFTWVAGWGENGVDQIVAADNAKEDYPPLPPSGHSGTLYDLGIEAYPVNGQDNTPLNNYALYGTWNASRLVGDIRQDGIVNILDAIKLSTAFGATPTSTNWNANADLKVDSLINVLDAILVSNNFNKHVP